MHFSDLCCKLSNEKLPNCVLLPFMLYMPYSTLFVQENASKDKNVSSSQDFVIGEICAISEIFGKVPVRFRN